MQSVRYSLLLVGLFVLSTSTVRAEWYTGADIGVVLPHGFQNNEGSGSALGVSATGMKFNDLTLDPGLAVGWKAGYFFENLPWLGLEADIHLSRPHLKSQSFNGSGPLLTVTSTTQSGYATVVAPAFHLMLRYPGEKIQPYVGVGPALGIVNAFDSTSAEIGLSAVGGLRYFFAPKIALYVEYQYLQTTYKAQPFSNAPDLTVKGDYSASHLLFGLSFHFGRNTASSGVAP